MDKRIIKSRQAIDAALIRILQKKHFDDITVSELSKEANLDRKTFYAHYDSINDVLIEIEDDMASKYRQMAFDVKPFDSSVFIDKLADLTIQNLDRYSHYARNQEYSFVFQDGKNVLKQVFIEELLSKSNYNEFEFAEAMGFLAAGIIDHLKKWLLTPNHSIDELIKSNQIIKTIMAREIENFSISHRY